MVAIVEPNYDELYKELASFKIKLHAVPTPKILLEQLSTVQAYRSRVSQMLIDAIIIRRMFKNQWLVYWDNALPLRTEKSAEQREAAVRNENRAYFEMFKRAEDYCEIVSQVYKDLIDTNNNLARQSHILEQELKLNMNRDLETEVPMGKSSWENLAKE